MRNLSLIMTIASLLAACGQSGRTETTSAATTAIAVATKPAEKITMTRDSVLTLVLPSDSSQSYIIYYPAGDKSVEKTPIVICFDPHGDGKIPVEKYKKWASSFGIAIAASNSSKNGIGAEVTLPIANNMIADIHDRLGFDLKNMTICGFSGGAKVAINVIEHQSEIPNLIYAGAVIPLNAGRPVNILGFAGVRDMNYTDLLQFDESVRAANPNSDLIEFNGKHEWPDATIFENAFYWIAFQNARQTKPQPDRVPIKTFVLKTDKAISEDGAKKDVIAEYNDARTGYVFLNGLTDVSVYKTKMESLAASEEYKKAMAQKAQILQKEANAKQMLLLAFQKQSADWWTKVINGYNASINASDKRLLGFISLAAFSYSNQMLQQHNLDGAEKMLAIYALADPANSDQLYGYAVLYAQKGNTAMAIQYLRKAIAKGFDDGNKLASEPAFVEVRKDPNYFPAVAALGKSSR